MTDKSGEKMQAAVRKKYTEISRSIAGKFSYLTGKAGAAALGYDLSALSDPPDDAFDPIPASETHSRLDHFAPEKQFST